MFLTPVLAKKSVKTSKRVAFGFSISAVPLLERLKASKHVDQIFISDFSTLSLGHQIEGLVESLPIDFLKNYWQKNNKLIFVGAIGAVVRLVSPFVESKENDPAVIVLDSKAKNVITLLGGHKQGGDAFANELGASLEAEVVCTSDSFTEKRISLDCFGEGWG